MALPYEGRAERRDNVRRREQARRAFHRLLSKIDCLHFYPANPLGLLTTIQNHSIPSTLRRIDVQGYGDFFQEDNAKLWRAIERFDLHTLNLPECFRSVPSSRADGVRLPSLRSLRISSGQFKGQTLSTLAHFAPSLTSLTLGSVSPTSVSDTTPSPHLPQLRHLSLNSDAHGSLTPILSHFSTCPLQTLEVDAAWSDELSPLHELFPLHQLNVLPRSLHRISIRSRNRLPPQVDDELRRRLADRGVSISTF